MKKLTISSFQQEAAQERPLHPGGSRAPRAFSAVASEA